VNPRRRPPRSIVALFVATLSVTSYGLMATTSPTPGNSSLAKGHATAVPLPNPYVVELLGKELAWHYRHPVPDGPFQTLDDPLDRDSLKVPAEHAVTLRFQSADFVYTWSLPALGAEQIAVPGMTFEVALPPLPAGRYDFLGTPFCGRDHSRLSGQLIAIPRDQSLVRTANSTKIPTLTAGLRPASK
jgi:heme/copper-type cytochrome/quinol oxidase subunit 2